MELAGMRTAGSEASEDSGHLHGARKGERMLPVPTCYLLLVCAASLVFCCVFLCAPRSCLGLYWFLFTMFSLVLVSAWWTGCFVVNTADRIMGLRTYSTVVAHRNGDSGDTISNEGDDDDWSILHHVHNGIDHSSYDEQYGGGENGGGSVSGIGSGVGNNSGETASIDVPIDMSDIDDADVDTDFGDDC